MGETGRETGRDRERQGESNGQAEIRSTETKNGRDREREMDKQRGALKKKNGRGGEIVTVVGGKRETTDADPNTKTVSVHTTYKCWMFGSIMLVI